MRSERRAIGHLGAAIADLYTYRAIFKMITVNEMIVAKDAQAGRIGKIISKYLVEIAMTQSKLSGTIANGIEPKYYARCFYRNEFVLAIAVFKQIILYNA